MLHNLIASPAAAAIQLPELQMAAEQLHLELLLADFSGASDPPPEYPGWVLAQQSADRSAALDGRAIWDYVRQYSNIQ